MKKNYFSQPTFSYLIAVAAMLIGNIFTVTAQVAVPFVQRTSQYTPTTKIYNVKGDFTMVGNTNLTLVNYSNTTDNNNVMMRYVDVDGNAPIGMGEMPTFNSSAATLSFSAENGAIPSCSNVLFAGLYWTGRTDFIGNSPSTFPVTKTINGTTYTKEFDKHKILLKGPNSSIYTEFSANTEDIFYPATNTFDYIYSGFAEVTDYVRTNGIGEYIAADIATKEGDGHGTGYSGGWGMIVIYENPKMNHRDVTIFDGHAYVVKTNTTGYDLPVSGFNTVQTGPVGIKMGIMASEGDVNLTGDYFKVRKNSDGSYINLNHSQNTATNFFNSSINTGGNPRNPNLQNNTGIDISMFNVPNANNAVFGNNQTQTNFRYGTAGDTYAIFAIAMAVDAYVPDIEGDLSSVSINGNPPGSGTLTALPGQTLEYKIELRNKGTEAVNNTKLVVPIPFNATYVPNSATRNIYFSPLPTPNSLTFEPTLGANGALVWDFGTLPLPANAATLLADLTFKFKVTEDCNLLRNSSCNNVVSVNGSLSGVGAVTGIALTNRSLIQGHTSSGLCQGNEIPAPFRINIDATDFISQNCAGSSPVTAFTFCNTDATIPITAVSNAFPPGSLFYNQYPITGSTIQYTINRPFPATPGISTYYAVPPGASSSCFFEFTINVKTITSVPSATDVVYCVGQIASPLTAVASNPAYTLYYYSSTTSSAQLSITPSTQVAGVTTYYVAEGESSSCIGPKTAIQVTVNSGFTTPIAAEPIQPTCTVATGSVVLSGLPSGNYTITQLGSSNNTYTGSTPTFTVVSLAAGTYIFTVALGECTSPVSTSVTINTAPVVPTAPIAAEPTQPTCTVATGSIVLSGLPSGTYTLTQSGSSNNTYNGSTATFTISDLAAGTYTFTVSSGECTSPASTSVTINIAPLVPTAPIVAEPIQPTCTTSTGSVVLSGLPSGNYTITQSGSSNNSYAGSTSTFAISNLTAGTYSFTVTSGECTSPASTSVTINTAPILPTAPIAAEPTQPTCTVATGSVVLSGLPSGNYTITQSGSSNNTYTGSTPTFTVVDLTAGTYTFTVTSGECTSPASTSVTINTAPILPTAPIAGEPIQPTCTVATGSVVLSGLPSGTYTITQSGSSNNTYTGSTSTFTVSGLTVGTYTFTVTSAECTSPASASVTVNAAPVVPTAPIAAEPTQPTCTIATGSVVLSGLPTGNYTITQSGSSNNTYTGSTPTFTVVDLTAGTYTFTVASAECTSPLSTSVTINTAPVLPTAPIAAEPIQPTCTIATGSVVLSGLPSGNYTITQSGSSNNTYTGSTSTFTVSGLTAGTYTFTVTSGECTSPASTSVTINTAPVVPTAPIAAEPIQPTCTTSTGSVVLSGLPSGNYTITQAGSSNNSYAGSTSTFTVSGLTAGTYTFTVASGECTSPASTSVTINTAPVVPTAPIVAEPIQPTCTTSTGSVVLSGLPSGNYTITQSGSSNNTYAGSTPTFTVVDLTAGTYTFTVVSGECTSPASTSVTINTAPVVPTAPIAAEPIQPTCTIATGSVVLSGLPTGNYTITQSGSSNNTYTGSTSTFTVSGLTVGTYTFTVTSGECTSPASTSVTINTAPILPTAPIVAEPTQPTCTIATGSVVLSGLPTGNYTITQSGSSNNTYTGSTSTFTVSGLTAGTYTFTVTSAECISSASTSVTINTAAVLPTAPIAAEPIQPTCTIATGSVVLSGLPSGNYTITQSGSSNNTYTGSTPTFTVVDLTAGTYTFTVTSGECTSPASTSVTINTAPILPTAPIAAEPIQPTCTTATGSVVLSGLPTGTYMITQSGTSNNTYTGSTSTFTVVDLAAGTYTFTVTSGECTSPASISVTINTAPVLPTAPIAAQPIQPTCTNATGSVVLSGLPTGTYTITQSGTSNNTYTGSTSTFTVVDLAAGTYTFTVTSGECISPASTSVTINIAPVLPTPPIAAEPTQPTCTIATGSVVLSGLPSGNYTITQSGSSNNTYAGTTSMFTVSGLTAGTYTFTVASGECTSPASTSVTINTAPILPTAPIVAEPIQPTCTTSTGSVVLSGLPSGNYTITQSGSSNNTYTGSTSTFTVSGLTAGTYTFTVTSAECISSASASVTINTAPVLPTAPIVAEPIQPTCTVATGSVVLSGLPSGTYTITQSGSSNNTYTGSTSTFTVSGLAAGTYTFTVTSAECISSASASVTINTAPVLPTAPIVAEPIQPTCTIATGSVVLSGLPSGNYTITQSGSSNNTYAGTTSTFTVSGLTAGTYTFTVALGECTSPASTSVTINAAPVAPTAPIATQVTQPNCDTTTGSVLLSGLPTGNWTLNLGDGTTLIGTGNTFTIGGLNESTTYNISVTNSLGCESPATTVVINAAGETVNLADEACNGDDKLILNLALKLPPGTPLTGVWTNLRDNTTVTALFNPFGLPNGVYNIQYVVASGSCTQTFVVAVTVDSNLCDVEPVCSDPIIPNAFSPNGDALNDVFVINGLDSFNCFPTNSIEIYNRWGVLVYDTKQYDNNTKVFRGISEGRATLSKSSELPAGTYFYILEYLDVRNPNNVHTEKKQGYIYLSK